MPRTAFWVPALRYATAGMTVEKGAYRPSA